MRKYAKNPSIKLNFFPFIMCFKLFLYYIINNENDRKKILIMKAELILTHAPFQRRLLVFAFHPFRSEQQKLNYDSMLSTLKSLFQHLVWIIFAFSLLLFSSIAKICITSGKPLERRKKHLPRVVDVYDTHNNKNYNNNNFAKFDNF